MVNCLTPLLTCEIDIIFHESSFGLQPLDIINVVVLA